MQAVLQWVLAAGVALLAIAVLVASWEQLRGEPAPEPAPEPAAPPRTTGVDIELDPALALRGGSGGDGDRQARSRALDSALDRMAQPRPRNPAGWTDTEPMVGPGPRAEAPGTPAQPRSTATH